MIKRVMVVDDHALVRAGICALLGNFEGFQVVAEAANGRDALKMLHQTGPDIVLMDIAMHELNGLDACERILRQQPECIVIILSMHTAERYVIESLRRGARAYVLKDAAPHCLKQALNSVLAGRLYLSPPLSPQILSRIAGGATRHDSSPLTVRQREILQLIAEGSSSRQISEQLHISVKTVETHRAQLMQRLDIYDVAGLTRYAIRIGLIPV